METNSCKEVDRHLPALDQGRYSCQSDALSSEAWFASQKKNPLSESFSADAIHRSGLDWRNLVVSVFPAEEPSLVASIVRTY